MPTSAALIPPAVIFAGLSMTRATHASYCGVAAPLVGTTPHAELKFTENEIRNSRKKNIRNNIGRRWVSVDAGKFSKLGLESLSASPRGWWRVGRGSTR